ncbi:hypothetical protein AB0392_09470 [Nonomuraea angiospora]|uniref:hypothetical protein n=1 Tax=Nonomuraea angiospora TaxID=46172 RepID=UPI00345001D2
MLGVEGEPHGGVMQSYVLLGEFPHEGSADCLGLDRLVFLIQIFPQALGEQLRYLTVIPRAARIPEVRIYRVLFLHFDFIAETQVCRGDTELHHVRQRMSMSLWVQGPKL